MDLCPLPNCTRHEYHRECAALMDVKHFDAMTVDGKDRVIHDRNRFERDTGLGAWDRHWAMLSRRCVEILVDARFANMPFVLCEHGSSYCRKL